ncbi:MAG: DUF3883 domain-containing protein [Gemmatimonadaceae bacterium]
MSDVWSLIEVEATITDYVSMLTHELQHEPYNKTEHRRRLARVLNGRSDPAIERKHQNISRILIDLGYPYIAGYKPLANYQLLLRTQLEERVALDRALATLIEQAVTARVADVPEPAEDVFVELSLRIGQRRIRERSQLPERPRIGIDYLEREARNHSLGRAGEEFVLAVEHRRLWAAGHRQLADRVEHVSHTHGDGLGYDILSFEESGSERLIEVKTTRYGEWTPFYATAREVSVSEREATRFQLYRVFAFGEPTTRLFALRGSLRLACQLDPVQFRATVA